MIRPILGIQTDPILAKPTKSSQLWRLQFLQHNDIFFSNQSYRAQLSRFLSQIPKKPIMFSFAPQAHELWERFAPANQRDIILIIPRNTNQMGAPKPKHHKASAREGLSNPLKPLTTFETIMQTALDDEEPASLKTQPMPNPNQHTTEDEKSTDILIHVHELAGQLVESHRFLQMEQAFQQGNLNRQTVAWVHQTKDGISVLPVKNPQQAGFQQVNHRWLSLLHRILAKTVAPLLGLELKGEALLFPNGACRPLAITSWKDSQGNTANLYQAVGLPNGTWLKITAVKSEDCVPFSAPKILRKVIEAKMTKLEQTGKLRELPLIPASPPQTPGQSSPLLNAPPHIVSQMSLTSSNNPFALHQSKL